MDAALGHLVFSMKYDVIGDQEHLRLMLRYSFLLSLSLTCFLHHLWFYSAEFSFIITALDFTPLPLHHLPLSHFVFSYFCFSLIFCLHCLFLHRICNSPITLLFCFLCMYWQFEKYTHWVFFLHASLDTFSFCSKITLNQGKMSQSKVAFSVPPIQSVVLTGCLSYNKCSLLQSPVIINT